MLDGGGADTAPEVMAAGAVCTRHGPVAEPERTLGALRVGMGPDTCDLLVLFVSPSGDLDRIARCASNAFPDARIIGCTTAGEISREGYSEDTIVAVAFRSSHMLCRTVALSDLKGLDRNRAAEAVVRARNELSELRPDWAWDFAFLMIDGLSLREDQVVASLRLGLGGIPLFGGSAGDGMAFRTTRVLVDGAFREDAAVLAILRSRCPVKVFKFDHLHPTAIKMVVTDADPERRVVREINAESAAREYARLVGKDPEQLSPFTFAAHPVVVTVGGQHHVRSIQKVEANGDLTFFSAIDEGLVLTVAEPVDIAKHLEASLGALSESGPPDSIIGCDCFLRRLEVEQTQATGEMSRILSENRVVGFNTYGEQFGSVHVNQTFTGVAIYPPEDETR